MYLYIMFVVVLPRFTDVEQKDDSQLVNIPVPASALMQNQTTDRSENWPIKYSQVCCCQVNFCLDNIYWKAN